MAKAAAREIHARSDFLSASIASGTGVPLPGCAASSECHLLDWRRGDAKLVRGLEELTPDYRERVVIDPTEITEADRRELREGLEQQSDLLVGEARNIAWLFIRELMVARPRSFIAMLSNSKN